MNAGRALLQQLLNLRPPVSNLAYEASGEGFSNASNSSSHGAIS